MNDLRSWASGADKYPDQIRGGWNVYQLLVTQSDLPEAHASATPSRFCNHGPRWPLCDPEETTMWHVESPCMWSIP